MQKEVVIIGGGLGGLLTGAVLAKEGCHVTVLEKNDSIGGGMQTFQRFGQKWETGMHVVPQMHEGQNVRRLCDYIGITDRLRLAPIGCDRVYLESTNTFYEIKSGRQGFVSSCASYFPEEREGLQRYVDAMYKLVDDMALFNLRKDYSYYAGNEELATTPADEFIASFIGDANLRSLLAYIALLYSGLKGVTPAYIHAVVSVTAIEGTMRFVDGSESFAELLASVIEEHGGRVVTEQTVVAVQTSKGLVKYVETMGGNRYYGDYFISDILPATLIGMLDNPKFFSKAFRTRLSNQRPTCSAFKLYIRFKPETFSYLPHLGWYLGDEGVWTSGTMDDSWPKTFLYTTPPVTGQGKWTNKMIIIAPMDWDFVRSWKDTVLKHRTKEYVEWKRKMSDRVLQRMEELYPGFGDTIQNINTSSPLTIRDYLGCPSGCMSGYLRDGSDETSQLSVNTKVKNLFLTGQYVFLHGFCGVAITAIRTCEAILGTNYMISKLNE